MRSLDSGLLYASNWDPSQSATEVLPETFGKAAPGLLAYTPLF